MKQCSLTIQNPTGLHARPAKVLVNLAKQFQSDIRIQHKEKRANAKSMVSVLTLGATRGSVISVEIDGEDEELALTRIEAAILSGLGDGTSTDSGSVPQTPLPAKQTNGGVQGIGAAPGMAIGPIFHFRPPQLDESDLAARTEMMSLDNALDQAKEQLTALHRQLTGQGPNEEAEIFEAHREFLEDPELLQSVRSHLNAGQRPAQAWKTAMDERIAAIAAVGDPLLSARADDLRDVNRRVLRLLLGISEERIVFPAEPVVVVASELSPSQTASFDPGRVLGFVLVNGGPTSHVAILARAMGIPAVVSVDESVLALPEGMLAILDGQEGTLLPGPDPDTLVRSRKAQEAWLDRRKKAQEQAELPAVTLDGRAVAVTANAGSHADALEAMKQKADGIGLLRTEFLFLNRTEAPQEAEQTEVYRAIAETMKGKPVIVRTMDIGGDKPLAYLPMKAEANPFLGERGIRLCLSHPQLFREQLRAILRASSHGHLEIMFPMISDLGELREAKAMVEEERQRLGAASVKIGIMIEVPSAALLADRFAPEIEFFSIGTNDLTQYTLAIDRGHPGLAARHDGLHPAVLNLISKTVEGAHRFGKRVDVCGELGSDPLAIPILVGLGVDELSVSIPVVPTVKAQVRAISMSSAESLARRALACSTAAEVRELVRNSVI